MRRLIIAEAHASPQREIGIYDSARSRSVPTLINMTRPFRADCAERGRSAGVAQQPADDVGGLLVGPLSPMGVDLHRRGAVGVAQSRRYGRHGHACVQELRRLKVTEVV